MGINEPNNKNNDVSMRILFEAGDGPAFEADQPIYRVPTVNEGNGNGESNANGGRG